MAREPIEVNAGAEGVQPDLEDAVTSVLSSLTTFESAEQDFESSTGDEKFRARLRRRLRGMQWPRA